MKISDQSSGCLTRMRVCRGEGLRHRRRYSRLRDALAELGIEELIPELFESEFEEDGSYHSSFTIDDQLDTPTGAPNGSPTTLDTGQPRTNTHHPTNSCDPKTTRTSEIARHRLDLPQVARLGVPVQPNGRPALEPRQI